MHMRLTLSLTMLFCVHVSYVCMCVRLHVPMCPCVPHLQYTAGSPGYSTLAKEVRDWEHQPANPAGRLFYLALPPYVYPEVNACWCV